MLFNLLLTNSVLLINELTNSFTVKSGVLFPPILLHSRQYCNVHALIALSKLHRNLQVATISISTNLLISWQIFAYKNTAKQY